MILLTEEFQRDRVFMVIVQCCLVRDWLLLKWGKGRQAALGLSLNITITFTAERVSNN